MPAASCTLHAATILVSGGFSCARSPRPTFFHLSLPVEPVPVPVPVLALPALPSTPRGFCVCLPAVVVTATALCCSPAQTSRRRDSIHHPSTHPCRAQTPADRSLVLPYPASASKLPQALSPYRRHHCNPPRCATLAHSVCLQDRASVTVTMRQRKFSFDLPRLVCRRRRRPPFFFAC
jgi:hypothetical protein